MDNFIRSRLQGEYAREHERFTVEADDGVTLSGVHLSRGARTTALLFCHGALASKNHLPVQRFVTRLADDCDVVAFDFRGHGASGGESTLAAEEVRDVEAIAEYALSLGYERAVGVGTSMGGAALLRYQAKAGRLDGVVTIGAFADASRMRRPITRLGMKLVYGGSATRPLVRLLYGVRPGSPRDMTQPVEAVHRIRTPLLVLHGGWDPLVEPQHAQEIVAGAAGPAELVVFPRGGHVESLLNEDTRHIIRAWLERHSFL